MKRILFLVFAAIFAAGCSSEDTPTPDNGKEQGPENPVAVDDVMSATENEKLEIEAAVLLDNDTTTDNARITSVDTESSKGGAIKDNRDGTYTYTPPSDFQGEDSFTYTICVPGESDRCSTAVVTLNLGDAGEPVANDDNYEIEEGESINIKNFDDNDQLVDNATISDVNDDEASGTAVIEEDGTITYTPAEGFSGVDSFIYTVCDDDDTPNCDTATITITVTDEGSPVAEDDTVVVSSIETSVVLKNLLNNDVLTDDAVISSVEDSGNGSASLNEDGTVTYELQAGFTGDDTFTYTLCDDDAEATCVEATVTVSVVEAYSFDIPANLEDYYNDVVIPQVGGTVAYQALSNFTNAMHTTYLEYTDRHDYLYDADADPNDPDSVILMYSGEVRPDDEYQLGDLSEGETYNTEHIYPQSKLNEEEAKNDLHHMRVADVNINSERLNYPYTDGSGSYKLIDGDKWYPGDDWRGDVARMVFYVNLTYGDSFGEVGSLEMFLEWNRVDPVSELEIQRNNVIEGAQGNRNPFIDNPYLATLIWGGQAAENRWE